MAMNDSDVLKEVMKLERERTQLRNAKIDPALKARLMRVIVEKLEALTLDTLSAGGQAAASKKA